MKDEPLPSLPRTNPDVPALRERCRKLEKALRETQELVRARDKEVDRLRRELEWTRKESQENLHLAQQAQAAQQQQQRQQRLRRQQSMDAATWHRRQRADRMSDSEDTDTDDEDNPLPPPPMPVSIHSVPLPNTVEQRARTLGLEAFLNKHDSWSGAEVVQAVQDLNAEVLQYAAAAAEACASEALLAHKSNSSRPPASKVAQAIQDTAGRLGAPFVRVLATREHAHDPILVQFAVQACVSTAIQRFWLAFCPGLSAKYDALLAQLYMHMHLSGVFHALLPVPLRS